MTPPTKKFWFAPSWLASLGVLGWLGLCTGAAPAQPVMTTAGLPLCFEANHGQVDSQSQFIARGRDSLFLISPTSAQFVLCRPTGLDVISARRVRMQFAGANGGAQISGTRELSGKINYLDGRNPAHWHTGVAAFARVRVGQLYPGINLSYYANQRQLEYDLTVAPGANPGVIAMRFDGADKISISPSGTLVLKLGDREIREPKPVIYQTANGVRQSIRGGYKLLDDRTVAFTVGGYDRSHPLVIDPILSYSTYFGGAAADAAWKVAVDTNGFVYVAGETLSTKLATGGAFQTNFAGGTYTGDAFVAKFSNDGSNLVYCTYLGGSQDDYASGLAVDHAGDAFLTGFTDSPDFPTTNALFPKILGHAFPHGFYNGNAFVAELDPTGSHLVYSTYLGGSGKIVNGNTGDGGTGIALDAAGNAYVTGYTTSTNFPVVNPLSFQLAGSTNLVLNRLAGFYNAFLTKIGPGGTNLLYSTYFGGTNIDMAEGVTVDPAGAVYLAGFTDSTNFPTTPGALQPVLGSVTNAFPNYNAFAAKFGQPSATNLALVYSTFLGGVDNDLGYGVAADSAGNAYVAGEATSPNFTNTAGFFNELTNNLGGLIVTTNAFLTKLNPAGSLVYSAVFGGEAGDVASGVAVDAQGNAFVCGSTTSASFPTTNTAPNLAATNAGGSDAFVAAFNTNATALLYSTYLGGANDDFGYGLALDPQDNVYVVGQTLSANFPTNRARQVAFTGPSDTFLAKIISTLLPPDITTQPTNQSAGVGTTVNLAVGVTGTPPFSYQWQLQETNLTWTNLVNGGSLSGATNDTLTISDAGTANSGHYQVIVTNYAGVATSSVAILMVTNTPVVITRQPASQTNGVGSTVTFYVQGQGTEVSFQWFRNDIGLVDGTNSSGSIITGATNSNVLEISNAQTNDSGSYSIIVSNSVNSAASSNAILEIVTAPAILTPPADQTVGLGAVVQFSVTAVGQTPLGYRWLMDGTDAVGRPISGANTNATLTLTNAQIGDSGRRFSVIVTNLVGAVTSSPPAVLTVLAAPQFTLISAAGGTNFIFSGVGGTNGGAFDILTSSNLLTPLGSWVDAGTNYFDSQGAFNFSYTLTNSSPQQFFILQTPAP